ncbi:MAG: serine/threonine-protein kinase [Myxococcota bacterium]|nr:serine/threonine-protein kinase [Myxococcota bacterium]
MSSSDFPKHIGDYVPERLLGRGAMAAVYLCRGPDGGPVALKWLDHPHPPLLRRFRLEILALKQLAHPGIVRFRDHGVFDGRPFLVMEYIDGSDLREYARKLHLRPPSERYSRCRTVGRALAEALDVMHGQGLIHRDVKPSNVLVDSADRVVLTDFGVIKDTASIEHTSVGQLIGTVAYAAPEQIRCEKVDPRADLYGLGATLYYVLTLARPFEGLDRGQLPPLPSRYDPNLPADLESIIMRLLSPDPRSRYADAREVARVLTTGGSSDVSLAGRQRIIHQVSAVLDRVGQGEGLVVRARGVPGTNRNWLTQTLLHGARRRGLGIWTPPESEDSLRDRLSAGEALLGVIPPGHAIPDGIPIMEIRLEPLGIADVRRTLVSAAPLTADPARAADLLHRLTGGLPALLIPLISQYIDGAALVLPDELPEPDSVTDFFEGLDLDELDLLAAMAAISAPASATLIEEIAMIPARPALDELERMGLVRQTEAHWRLAADLFAAAALSRTPDPEGLAARTEALQQSWQADHPEPTSVEDVLDAALLQSARGELAVALAGARRAVEASLSDRGQECRARCVLGQVLLDTGLHGEAARQLADATALAKAADRSAERRVSHALRARAILETRPGRPAAAAAIDRLLPLVLKARTRPPDTTDAAVFATWARAAAMLGDRRAWNRAWRGCTDRFHVATELDQRRMWLALAKSAAAIGDAPAALTALERSEVGEPLGLLAWEAGQLRAAITNTTPPPTSPLAYGLRPEELAALKRRTVFVSGRIQSRKSR